MVVLRGKQVLVAGDDYTTSNGLTQQFSLTCSDTSGTVRWRRVYTRSPYTGDWCTGLAALPNGGYLLTGNAYNFDGTSTTYPAQLIETDSIGRQRRRVLIQPLGPNYQEVEVNDGFNTVLVLPNYGGYILSGTADSAVAGVPSSPVRAGYLMRLDTALRVQWVYRHPPGFGGTGTRSQRAFKVRQLTNGTLAFLLQDIGPFSGATHLVHVSLGGQRLGHYDLLSRAFTNLAPFDWLWLDDGTLLLCGKAMANPGVAPFRAYLARWDLRQTPLAARQLTSTHNGFLEVFPNPAVDQVYIQLTSPAAAGASFRLVGSDGRIIRQLTMPPNGQLILDVNGIASGLYSGQLLDRTGVRATRKIAVVR